MPEKTSIFTRTSVFLAIFAVFLHFSAVCSPILAEKAAVGLPWDDPPPELWFPVGEAIDYEVFWGIFMVGEGTASAEWVNQDGRRLLALSMTAKSNGLVENLYPVKQWMQTLLDPVTFLPLVFEKRTSEGKRRAHERMTFDHAAKKAHWVSYLKNKEKVVDIEADTRDLMGLMYWIRKDPIRAGQKRSYRVMADEKMYELEAEAERVEKVALAEYGKVTCIKMEPKGKFNGMFIRKGRMWIWLSDDERYLICRATASVPVASIKVMLKRVRGPGNDVWVRKTKK